LMHVIAAKAITFKEASTAKFRAYQEQIVKNSKELAKALAKDGFRIVSGGTETHLMLVDLSLKGITGAEASGLLEEVNITANKNLIPFDKESPAKTSGIRLGTAAVTTRGMKEPQMRQIAGFIQETIETKGDYKKMQEIKNKVLALAKKFPLYPELRNA
jgi:glycine hydroxymethyltransferase